MYRKKIIVTLLIVSMMLGGCAVRRTVPEDTAQEEIKSEALAAPAADLLDPEIRKALSGLDSDYSKVRWGVEYSPIEECPGIVVSVAPLDTAPYHYLVVGITNLNPFEVIFSGDMEAMDTAGQAAGTGSIYEDHIGSGQTAGYMLYCGSETPPDGRICWKNMTIRQTGDVLYEPYTADWTILPDPDKGTASAAISLSLSGGKDPKYRKVTALIVDERGKILSGAYEIVDSIEPEDGCLYLPMEFLIDPDRIGDAADMCIMVGL